MNLVCQFIEKVQLGRKLEASPDNLIGSNFEVNMHGSDRIPAGVNGKKPCFAPGISHLVSAQKLLAKCAEPWIFHVRIDTRCIALPDIDLRSS